MVRPDQETRRITTARTIPGVGPRGGGEQDRRRVALQVKQLMAALPAVVPRSGCGARWEEPMAPATAGRAQGAAAPAPRPSTAITGAGPRAPEDPRGVGEYLKFLYILCGKTRDEAGDFWFHARRRAETQRRNASLPRQLRRRPVHRMVGGAHDAPLTRARVARMHATS